MVRPYMGSSRSLAALSLLMVISAIGSPLSASGPSSERTSAMILVTSECITQMRTYRFAIRFLDKRLKASPPTVTYEFSNGDSITLLNRHHTRMRSDLRVLIRGMQDKAEACRTALRG